MSLMTILLTNVNSGLAEGFVADQTMKMTPNSSAILINSSKDLLNSTSNSFVLNKNSTILQNSSLNLTKYLGMIDKNHDKIDDSFEMQFETNRDESFNTLICLNQSSQNYATDLQILLSNAVSIRHQTPNLGEFFLSGQWTGTYLNQIRQRAALDPTFLYITEDAQVNESMLDTLNQLQMNTPEFYALNNYGDSNMRIAFLDRGIDPTNIAFAGKDILWKDFTTTESSTAFDPVGHGTATAAIAAGNAFTATDDQGRTIISTAQMGNFDGDGLVPGTNYLFFLGAVNYTGVNRDEYPEGDTVTFNATWTALADSDMNIIALTILDQAGNYIVNQTTNSSNIPTYFTHDFSLTSPEILRFGYIFNVASATQTSNFTIEANMHVAIGVLNQSDPDPNNPDSEFRGIAPNCKIAMLRCLSVSDTLDAMTWLLENAPAYNITVLSISLNFESAQAISLADQIAQSGVVVVCAAGNDGSSDYNSNGFYTAGNNAGSIYSAPGCL